MKLDKAEILLAAKDEDWGRLLAAFARHFGVSAIADMSPRPAIYKRTPESLTMFQHIRFTEYQSTIVYIRCGGREYRSDFNGVYDINALPGTPDSFVIVQLVGRHEAEQ